jgi:hypothetical protein
MTRKFRSTGTVTLAQSGANNTVIAAPTGGNASEREFFIRRLVVERTDTAVDVALIFLNNESPTPREIMPRLTLNSDKGAVWLEFDDETEVGVGGGKAFVVDASVGNKARITVEYRFGMAVPWPGTELQ